MLLIGLTGGIGMGKSTVAEYLARRGEKLIDTDVLARNLVEPGEPALNDIRDAFGSAVLDSSGRLNRQALAQVVFGNAQARKHLETILHPPIRAGWKKQALEWREAGVDRAFVVIPLLYETGAETEFDRVICVACSARTQRERLMKRGWSEEEIARRIAAQLPAQEKIDRADGVIWNESTPEISETQCARLVDCE